MVHKGLLERMEPSVPRQSFNGDHFLSFDLSHGKLTRTGRLVVNQDGTRSADTFSTTIFCSSEAKIGAQDPQKPPISIDDAGLNLDSLYGVVTELAPVSDSPCTPDSRLRPN